MNNSFYQPARGLPAMVFTVLIYVCGCSSAPKPSMVSQFPSPMVEISRAHDRIVDLNINSHQLPTVALLGKDVEVYWPDQLRQDSVDLFIHFHGASFIPNQGVAHRTRTAVGVVVNLGSGSSAYERPFLAGNAFAELLRVVSDSLRERARRDPSRASETDPVWGQVTVTAFSAGYGAVRGILRQPGNLKLIDVVVLMDALHSSYVPERLPIADGGQVDSTQLSPFVRFAQLAADGEKRMLITHSEIFPGTYASTTETADYIVGRIGIKRQSVLSWGPLGMQQVSEAIVGQLDIRGFAGNTAPDHIDHLHAYASWILFVDSIGQR